MSRCAYFYSSSFSERDFSRGGKVCRVLSDIDDIGVVEDPFIVLPEAEFVDRNGDGDFFRLTCGELDAGEAFEQADRPVVIRDGAARVSFIRRGLCVLAADVNLYDLRAVDIAGVGDFAG